MWEPRRVTTLWASTSCYRDSFTLILSLYRGVSRQGMNCLLDLLTEVGTESNYSAIGDRDTLQITTTPAKYFPAFCVLTSRSLATASNNGDPSASRAQVFLSQPPLQNSCQFPQLPTVNSGTRLTLLIIFRHEPHRKHCFHCYSPTVPRPLHAYPLPRELVYRADA
jgi:hypothetical protein